MAAIGNSPTQQAFTPAIDYFSGNGSTTAFTLSRPVASVAQVQVTIDNVAQNPSSAFTVSANTITFTSAPLSGTNNIYVYYTSPITQVIAPGQGTVTTTSLASSTGTGAVVLATSPTITTPTISSLSSASATALTLQSAGTTAITVNTSQNVGIGTTSPQRKVSIVGPDGATGQTEGNSRTSLFLDNNGANYLTIMTGTSGDGGVFFSDNGQNNGGMVYETSSDALYFKANNAERMRINSSGYITRPYQPAFSVYRNGTAQTIANGTPTVLSYETAKFNIGSCYNLSTYTFTAPIAGYYFFSAQVTAQGSFNSNRLICYVYRNGGQTTGIARQMPHPTSNDTGTNVCGILYLAAGDTTQAVVYQDSGGNMTAFADQTWGFFSGYLLG
jgi:hypothetical protein